MQNKPEKEDVSSVSSAGSPGPVLAPTPNYLTTKTICCRQVMLSLFFLQENFFDIQEALQAIHMRQEMLREQLACAKSKGEETVGRNLQVDSAHRKNHTTARH